MTNLTEELSNLSDHELHVRTVHAAKIEKEATVSLLYHLHEVQRRKLYAEKGYGSLWSYVTTALHYSESQTAERISAMRLMFRDEEAKAAIERGALTLTQAAITERFLRTEEKEKQVSVSSQKVRTLIEQVQGKSKRETEKILLSMRPEENHPAERIRQVSEEMSEVRFTVSEETRRAMERYWNMKGRCSVSEMFAECLEFYLREKSPSLKNVQEAIVRPVQESPAENEAVQALPDQGKNPSSTALGTPPAKYKKRSRYISVSVKREVRRRSEDQCEFVDSETGRRCESLYLLQFDHIEPYALGGTADLKNIRCLCANHNQYLAEKIFARECCESYGSMAA